MERNDTTTVPPHPVDRASDDRAFPAPSADWAWFLDVDGTLVDIADTPTAVHVAPDTVRVLSRLHRAFGGAVALVSGRPIDEIDALFSPFHPPAAGLHGLERRPATGRYLRHPGRTDLGPTRSHLEAFAAGRPGITIEDKGVTLAVHYRQAPQHAADASRLVEDLTASLGAEYHVQRGKMVLEIKPTSSRKGSAVRAFMYEEPFAGRRPVFVGDDITDEDAFVVVNGMDGHSIRVGDGEPTVAAWQIDSVSALHAWLRTIVDHEPDRGDAT